MRIPTLVSVSILFYNEFTTMETGVQICRVWLTCVSLISLMFLPFFYSAGVLQRHESQGNAAIMWGKLPTRYLVECCMVLITAADNSYSIFLVSWEGKHQLPSDEYGTQRLFKKKSFHKWSVLTESSLVFFLVLFLFIISSTKILN